MKFVLKILIAIVIINFILPNFGSVNSSQVALAQIQAPETLEEAQQFGEEVLEKTKEQLPGILEKSWKEEVLPVWRKMRQMWSNWWDNTIQPWLISIVDKIKVLLGQEIEKRKPYIEQEFEKETEELIKDIGKEIPKAKSLWERFKELIQ